MQMQVPLILELMFGGHTSVAQLKDRPVINLVVKQRRFVLVSATQIESCLDRLNELRTE